MATRPLLLPGASSARLRPLSEQLASLSRKVSSLSHGRLGVWEDAANYAIPEGFAGLVAVPRLDHFGAARIPLAAEAWHKATGWAIRTGIRGLESSRLFRAEDFETDAHTLSAFERLEELQGNPDEKRVEQNPMRVFLVRATREANPTLAEGEFLLDLASHIWILCSHTVWRDLSETLLFRCAGERFKPLGERAVLVGYRDSLRAVNFSSKGLVEGIALIGRIPELK